MTAVVLRGDAAHLPLPDASADLIVTSPPYFGLRSYTDDGAHYDGQIGSEATPAEWLAALVDCTREWVRVLKPSGSIFVNLGDKYAGGDASPRWHHSRPERQPTGKDTARNAAAPRLAYGGQPKSLLGLPWRYALACMDELGLILRRDIIWSKPNGLPESVQDRCRSSHEYLFHLVKQPRYYAAVDEIREPHVIGNGGRQRAALRGTFDYAEAGHDYGAAVAARAATGQTQKQDGLHATGYNPLGKLPGSVWEIPSQPLTVPAHLGVDHFAAFPMELPRRVILGWSPPGICTACGEGRRPVVDKGGPDPDLLARRGLTAARWHEDGAPRGHMDRWNISGEEMRRTAIPTTIAGYTCACATMDAAARRAGAIGIDPGQLAGEPRSELLPPPERAVALPPTRPAVVVDPFGGTGTTALVASMLGRTGISADLSGDYCRVARWRAADPAERAKALQVPKPPPVPDGQVSLFDLEAG